MSHRISAVAAVHPGQRLALVALALLAGLLLASPARAALTFPPLTGRVVDGANLLAPNVRMQLEQRLAALEQKSGDQLVIATVPSLQGTSVEDYANRLFRTWQLGSQKGNNGVLLLVAPNERRVRIEVGYGLEGIVTDAVSSTVIQTAILPAFRQGDFAGGVAKGTDALIEILSMDKEEARRRAEMAAQQPQMQAEDAAHLVFLLLVIGFILFCWFRAARGGRQVRRMPGAVILPGGITSWNWPRGGGGGGGFGGGGGGFSGGGGSSGGGGASGSW